MNHINKFFSESAGKGSHNEREEIRLCTQGKGSVFQTQPSILCEDVVHIPRFEQIMYLC